MTEHRKHATVPALRGHLRMALLVSPGRALLLILLIGAPFQTAHGAQPECDRSLQSEVDAAPRGSTVVVDPCIYRETVQINKPLTLVGTPGAEIRGSDIWTNWTHVGDYWLQGPAPRFSQSGPCQSGRDCQSAYQVFVDGHPLAHIATAPATGQFAIDEQRNVVLADDPANHQVEVTTRRAWLKINADDVTVDGLTLQHAANNAQVGALLTDRASRFTLRNSTLAHAHGVAVQLLNGTSEQLINNSIHHAGQLGVSGYQVRDVLVQNNQIHNNNTAGFDALWEAGGLKISSSSSILLEGNDVFANAGQGLWCDIHCENVTYRLNRIHDNAQFGLVFEVSSGATIIANTLWNNGSTVPDGFGSDIFVSSSGNVDITGNTVQAATADEIRVFAESRPDAPVGAGSNVSVHDNALVPNAAEL